MNNLANVLAKKLSKEVQKTIKENPISNQEFNEARVKALEKNIAELVEDNKILLNKLKELEQEKEKFTKVVGNLYAKN